MINTIKELSDKNISLTIAGNGDKKYVNSLKKLCKMLEVERIIKFTGPVYGSQKWELYANSDLFILPTHSENFGIVIAEALASGIPVITTTGTPWEDIITYKCGWWITLSKKNLKDSIIEAISKTPEQRYVMGTNGISLINQKYSIEQTAQQLADYYLYEQNN